MIDVKRVEKKYIIDTVSMENMKRNLRRVMTDDPHNGQYGYMVRSLYFDSFDDTDYHSKIDGLDARKKIRLRIYSPDAGTAKLEVKEKDAGTQRKRSLVIPRDDAEKMIRGDYSFLAKKDDVFSNALYLVMTKGLYRPKCIVEYDRYAFIHCDNNTRVTFDSNLRGTAVPDRLFGASTGYLPVSAPSDITLEVKYDGFLLSGIKSVIGDRLVNVISNSKYCRTRSFFGY